MALLDGHNSHHSTKFLNLAKSKNIEILCLPPHTVHTISMGLNLTIPPWPFPSVCELELTSKIHIVSSNELADQQFG